MYKSPEQLVENDAIKISSRKQLEYLIDRYKLINFRVDDILHTYENRKDIEFCILPINRTHSDLKYLMSSTEKEYTFYTFDDVYSINKPINYEVWY